MFFDAFRDGLEALSKQGKKISILGLYGNIEVGVTTTKDKIILSAKDGSRVFEVDRYDCIKPMVNGDLLIDPRCGERFVIVLEIK
jgi:hypothetical protein